MKKMGEMQNLDPKSGDDDTALEVLLDAAAICLMKDHPQYWEAKKHKHDETGAYYGGYSEEFEEAIDQPTINRIIKICGGVDFEDPDLIAAAMEKMDLGTT